MSNILITGASGFIGFHLSEKLKHRHELSLIDKMDQSKKASLKRGNLLSDVQKLDIHTPFIDKQVVKPEIVIHLAAETGLSGSLTNPTLYFNQNVSGTYNVLEQCRKNNVKYLIYASSSSVYSAGENIMNETSDTNSQLSFYGTSKKLIETMIENYCAQFGMTAIGLRFFTVYGSWTRPDMAAYKFMRAISNEQEVTLYNKGEVYRDFTHVSDVVNSIDLITDKIKSMSLGEHQIFNIGLGKPTSVRVYAETIANCLNKKLLIKTGALPKNELSKTHSDSSKLNEFIGYQPVCELEKGISEMVDWFKNEAYD